MGAVREFELEGWQAAAASYAGFAGATRLFVPALLQAAGAGAGVRLLDVACGPGFATAAAAAAGAEATGVDFSSAMLLMARSLHPAVPFRHGDAEDLPFADASQDAVVANFGIHHVERPERAFAEVHRVLRPQGTFAFTFWADPRDNTPWCILVDAIKAHGRLDVAMPAGNSVHATPESFTRLVAAAGFSAETVRHELITQGWSLPPQADLVTIFESGTVRTATLLRGQGDALPAIRHDVAQAMQRYLRDGRVVLPTRAFLMLATK